MSLGEEHAAPVLMVRYRAGVIGETKRTVHAVALRPASKSAEGTLTALCGTILNPDELEVVAFREGMPCLTCVLRCIAETATQVVTRCARSRRGTHGERDSATTV